MGLSIPSVGDSTIDRVVKRRMAKCGCATENQYILRIGSDASELQELIDGVVVPETWFFRDPESYTALENWLTREWFPNHRGETLKILSVPCSTGEEPYSIAMALRTLGIPASAFSIDAVDISASHLSIAQSGLYGPNSFRKSRLEFKQHYFVTKGSGFEIDEAVRSLVNFRQGNLLEQAGLGHSDWYHVIFCRNLLIYFNEETQERAMRHLDSALAAGGLLFLGSAEMFLARTLRYEPISHIMSFGYRKPVPGERHTAKPRPPVKPGKVNSARRVEPPSAAKAVPAKTPAPRHELRPEPDFDGEIAVAKKLADSGDHEAARKICDTLLAVYGPSPACYFLLGLIADAEGLTDSATAFYRKALYLDPGHQETLAQMAAAAGKVGNLSHAARLRKRATALPESTETPRSRSGKIR